MGERCDCEERVMAEKEYIEREALLRYLNDIWLSATPNDFMPDDDRQLAMVRCMGLNDAMDAVKSIPAADVRPVVRGEWQFHMFTANSWGYECRVCHTTWDTPTNYCPNCGADMREKS